MKESSLQFIWQHRLYSSLSFYEDVDRHLLVDAEILQPGKPNLDAGPDFSGAILRVGKLILVGAVEIHLRAGDWMKHRHHTDPAYDGVILHVVLEADRNVLHRTTQKPLLTAIVRCPPKLLKMVEEVETLGESLIKLLPQDPTRNFVLHQTEVLPEKSSSYSESPSESFISRKDDAPSIRQDSQEFIPSVGHPEEFFKKADTFFIERLKRKATEISVLFDESKGDHAEILYQLFLRHLGAKVNNDAFLEIARSLSLQILRKHTDSVQALEALYLGQAGLLVGDGDEYKRELQEEYRFFSSKYGLTSLAPHQVRLFRLRPAAFPYRRLAIAAQLRVSYPLLESLLLSEVNPKELLRHLSTPPSAYWQCHYAFNSPTPKPLGGLSLSVVNVLLLNVVLPYRYFTIMGKRRETQQLRELCVFARTLPAEKNRLVSILQNKGFILKTGLHTQAALEYLSNSPIL